MKQLLLARTSLALLIFATFSTTEAVQPCALRQLLIKPAAEQNPDRFDRLVILLFRLQATRKITQDEFMQMKEELISAIQRNRINLDDLSENFSILSKTRSHTSHNTRDIASITLSEPLGQQDNGTD